MSRWTSHGLAVFLAFACGCRPAAAGPLEALEPGGVVNVAAALDGETLRLTDGRELRLAGINVPAPELPWPGAATAATARVTAVADIAEAARQTLVDLADQRPVQIYYDERRNDRYGRLVAQVVVAPAVWLQAELLRRGLARVETTRDAAATASDLLAVEATARAARRGLWALAAYQVRDAGGDLQPWRDSFQIVAGRIAGTHKSPGRTWLEFAGAPGRALELAIPAAANRPFRAAKMPPAALVGAEVRVRGWLRWQNGPIIDVDHPAQIELIGKATAEDAEKRRAR